MKAKNSKKQKTPGQFRRNMAAMAARNLTGRQTVPIARKWRIWWHVSANLRRIEGSWYGALKRYMHIFKA